MRKLRVGDTVLVLDGHTPRQYTVLRVRHKKGGAQYKVQVVSMSTVIAKMAGQQDDVTSGWLRHGLVSQLAIDYADQHGNTGPVINGEQTVLHRTGMISDAGGQRREQQG